MLVETIAQMAADASANPLYAYGPMGIVLGWFMWRFELWAGRIVKSQRDQAHGLRGLESALLVEAATRDDCPMIVKNYAKKRIAKITADEEADK